MSKIEKLVNSIMLGVTAFVFLGFTTLGVSRYVRATGVMTMYMSVGFTLAMVYGVYVLVKNQLAK